MPVTILVLSDEIPLIISEVSEAKLEAAVRVLSGCAAAAAGIDELRAWLSTLPPPSGWFETEDGAKAFVDRVNRERDAKLMRAAIAHLSRDGQKLSQSAMAKAIGIADHGNDGAAVRKVLLAKHGLTGTARRALAYLVKSGPMKFDEQEQILNGLDKGAWRSVERGDIRRLV